MYLYQIILTNVRSQLLHRNTNIRKADVEKKICGINVSHIWLERSKVD
jgi:hypothetical protein